MIWVSLDMKVTIQVIQSSMKCMWFSKPSPGLGRLRVVGLASHHCWRLGCNLGAGRMASHYDTRRSTWSRRGTTKMPCNRRSQPIGIHHICCTAKKLSLSNESCHFGVHRFTKLQRHFLSFGLFFFFSSLFVPHQLLEPVPYVYSLSFL